MDPGHISGLCPSDRGLSVRDALLLLLALVASAACGNETNAAGMGSAIADSGSSAFDQTASADVGPADAKDSAPIDVAPLDAAEASPWDANTSDVPASDASLTDASVSDGGVDASIPDAATSPDGAPLDAARPGWRLVWNDEFEGPAGAPPDSTKWTAQVGLNASNGELEYYTARPTNLALDGNGNLLLTALAESFMGAAYTSARIHTAGKFEPTYGRFESRLKLPSGQGLWPAFWLLGSNIAQVPWPACGEVDIMENVGRDPTHVLGALHGPGYSGGNPLRATYTLAGGFSSDFHVFTAEWEQDVVRFYVDDNLFETRTPADLAARDGGLVWVYDHPFYIILNVAVGGGFPGNPNASTQFPQTLSVDYVRVYSR